MSILSDANANAIVMMVMMMVMVMVMKIRNSPQMNMILQQSDTSSVRENVLE
jgi:hypothetical protein